LGISRWVNRIFFSDLRSSILAVSLILLFLHSGCLFKPADTDIPILWVINVDSSDSPIYNLTDCPIYNLTRDDVSSIPVLLFALNETLASDLNNRNEYELTENESDQISLFFDTFFPPKDEIYSGWFVFFEDTLLHITLGRRFTHYD
jgi:hypothetical protein